VFSGGEYAAPWRVQLVDNGMAATLGKIEAKLKAMPAFCP
jgi:hypothetical protein